MRTPREEAIWEEGFETGYQKGYVRGRQAGLNDARAESRSAPPEDQVKGNGWVTPSEALREAYGAPLDATRGYIVRDMTGEIVGVTKWE